MERQSLLAVLLILQSILYSTHALSITSVVEKSCIVDTDKGQLDLTSLASSSQDPAFQDSLAEPGGSTLSIEWNPCKDIQPSGCDGGQGEIFSAESIGGQSECQMIGAKSDAKFGTAADSITLSYPGGYVITFTCTQDDTPSFKITDGEGLATTLSGKASCLKKPTPGPKKASDLSTGSVLCIIFAVVLLIYVLISVILMVATRNNAGGLQRVSNGNMGLIKSLLNNIKAGFLFSFSCCGKRSGYGDV